jgi:hypothetical protein
MFSAPCPSFFFREDSLVACPGTEMLFKLKSVLSSERWSLYLVLVFGEELWRLSPGAFPWLAGLLAGSLFLSVLVWFSRLARLLPWSWVLYFVHFGI